MIPTPREKCTLLSVEFWFSPLTLPPLLNKLMLCTGGFGAQANARGRTCYCISLFDGRQTSYYRSDVLGVIEPEKLPEWAKEGLAKANEIREPERKPPKERGEAR